MTKGSKSSGKTVDAVEFVGFAVVEPVERTVTYKGGGGERSYETKTRVSYDDKQSGSYGRETIKEKASSGEFQWKNGTSGTRNEYKQSSTLRIGDRRGYTEVYNEQRVRNVTYDKSGGGHKSITYDHGDGGNYGGSGYGSGSGSGGYDEYDWDY